ncbi:MAG: hypothetical protein KAW46_08725, partial [candidate division Zixibacteria bacterium]|nr:hypothetical protein [candidate division Zixibacteria bacterium]
AIKSIRVLIRQLVDAAVEAQSGLTREAVEAAVEESREVRPTTYTSEGPDNGSDKTAPPA